MVERDPDWDPYVAEPFLVPDEYAFIAGAPGFPRKVYGVSHVGAYQGVSDYRANDPVWVWEEAWRPAVVIDAGEKWIRVRYWGGFKTARVVRPRRTARHASGR
ncbi:hypothetical protein GCM10017567_73770 [Amycolatopsis bullii]|uniref:Uncharacterized protein n=1 Tax=Amycolatopsis bullii TaxID=941987 RepID=A0ABQ3KNY5_9PSEU|nr:hypothetical protein GCM10017567_73770 [Amycolatopsis bullii]